MNKYQFFEHTECEYYPCHNMEEINCLFCFCPMYFYSKCPGQFNILDNGIKDCSNCQFPHKKENYHKIMNLLKKSKVL